ncbi:MAG: hypothetical protein ACK55I_39545, partial [bacterium]
MEHAFTWNFADKIVNIISHLNLLPDGPRSNQMLTAQSIKAPKVCKKLQLSGFILRLFYNIRNLHIWLSLTAISFQSQNLC